MNKNGDVGEERRINDVMWQQWSSNRLLSIIYYRICRDIVTWIDLTAHVVTRSAHVVTRTLPCFPATLIYAEVLAETLGRWLCRFRSGSEGIGGTVLEGPEETGGTVLERLGP